MASIYSIPTNGGNINIMCSSCYKEIAECTCICKNCDQPRSIDHLARQYGCRCGNHQPKQETKVTKSAGYTQCTGTPAMVKCTICLSEVAKCRCMCSNCGGNRLMSRPHTYYDCGCPQFNPRRKDTKNKYKRSESITRCALCELHVEDCACVCSNCNEGRTINYAVNNLGCRCGNCNFKRSPKKENQIMSNESAACCDKPMKPNPRIFDAIICSVDPETGHIKEVIERRQSIVACCSEEVEKSILLSLDSTKWEGLGTPRILISPFRSN